MILRDGLYKFSLYPGCEALYIDKEGLTSTRLDDGTILEIPNYVYHPLSIYTLGMDEFHEYTHPSRNFTFGTKNLKRVPRKVMEHVSVRDSEKTKECLESLKKKAWKMVEQPVRSGVTVSFRFNKVFIKVYRKFWANEQTFVYYCEYDKRWRLSGMETKRDIWGLQDREEVVRRYAELFDVIEYILTRKDIPFVPYDFIKIISSW